MQNYFLDAQDRPKWRETEDAGLPPSAVAIVSPYALSAHYARRGETRWKGFLAHVTETCDPDTPSVITNVTTTKAAVHDTKALPGILANLERIGVHLPPAPARQPPNPTALQGFLDWQHIPRPRSWRVATHPES